MIEVKMYLYDAFEINLMSQFEAILEKKRAGQPIVGQEGEKPAAPQSPSVVSPAGEAQPIINEPDVQGAAHLPVPAAPREVSDIEVQRAITAYGQKHGAPATIARMEQEFGVSKASLCPVERRAEFVAAFAV